MEVVGQGSHKEDISNLEKDSHLERVLFNDQINL